MPNGWAQSGRKTKSEENEMTKKKKKTHEQQQQQQSRNVMLSKKTKTNGSVRCQANRRLALPDTDTNTLNKCFNLSSLKCSNVFCIYMYIMVSCLFFSSRLKVRKLETYFNSIRISLTLSLSPPFRFHFVCFFFAHRTRRMRQVNFTSKRANTSPN